MEQTFAIGAVVKLESGPWLVVRVCPKNETLFEHEGEAWVETETYVELRNAENQTKFNIISTVKQLVQSTWPKELKALKPYLHREDINYV